MFAFVRKSLSRKVALIVGSVSLLVTLIGLTGMMILFRSDMREQARTSLATLAEAMSTCFASFDEESGSHPFPALAAEVGSRFSLGRVRVIDPAGRIAWSQDEDEQGRTAPADVLASLRSGQRTFLGSEVAEHLGIVRQIRARPSCVACHAKRTPVRAGDLLGGLHLEVAHSSLTERLSAYAQLQVATALLLVAFVALMVVLTMRVLITTPLIRLRRAITAAESGDFLHRVEPTSQDEVGQLAEAFNRMLTRLTEVEASKIDSEMELDQAQRELSLKAELEEKNRIIEETNRKLTGRLNELGLLFDTIRALTSTLELDRVLEVINELIGVTLQYQKFSILLMDERREKLVVKFVYGAQAEGAHKGAEVDPSVGLVGQAVRTGKRVLAMDLSGLTERRGPIEEGLPEQGSFLCVPMLHKDSLLGVLTFTRPTPDGFPESELRLLTSLGRQAAMAIMNAQLYQEKLEMSVTDDLTKLANRRQLQTRLELEWNRARRFSSPLSVLMVDIDFFKRYNDVNGHLLGDQVLKGVADVLTGNTRKVDTVARFGGEEFVILLPGQDKHIAVNIAQKLRKAVARHAFPRTNSQPNGHLTITIGVATCPEDADDPSDLVDRADLALYVAKRAGRNQVAAYEDGMQTAEQERKAAQAKRPRKRRRRRRRPPAPRMAKRRQEKNS